MKYEAAVLRCTPTISPAARAVAPATKKRISSDCCRVVSLLRRSYMSHPNHFSLARTAPNIFRAQKIYGKNFPEIANTIIKKIEEILESFENVWIANYNCPGQIVITGLTNEVQQASLALKEAGAKRVVELKVSGPFHSLLLKPAGEALLKEMESMSFSPLQVPYIANATAEIVTDSKKISTFFAKGIYSSVRWQQSIETMLENGVDTFVEIGPGKTLAGFMRKIAPKATVYNVSSFEDATALEKCLSKA